MNKNDYKARVYKAGEELAADWTPTGLDKLMSIVEKHGLPKEHLHTRLAVQSVAVWIAVNNKRMSQVEIDASIDDAHSRFVEAVS